MPFADNSFDLVWSLESGEHMPDKTVFIQECYRAEAWWNFNYGDLRHRATDGELTSMSRST